MRLILDGYTPYLQKTPPRDALVRFLNEYTGQEWTGRARDLHPLSNAVCLWWKYTGIALAGQ